MMKERKEKELPKGKPRGRVNRSSSTRSQRNIPERKQQTQEMLRRSEEHYRTLAEQSLMGLAVMQDFHIIFANTAFAKIYGYTIDELLSLRPEKVGALVHPEDQALVWGRFRDRLAGKAVPPHYEYRGIRKDGTVRWLEIHANRIEYGGKPAVQAVYIDITEHKQAEESLRLSEQNFRDSIEKSPLGIRIVTEDGTTLYVNKALLDICDYGSLEELKAVPRNQLYTPESYAEHRERVKKRKRRKYVPSNYEISIVRKDGQVRRLAVSRGEVLWDGEKQSQVVYQDITERKQAEEALEKSEERYRQLAENAGEAIFVVQDGMIKFANPRGAELSGYSIEELVSSPVVKFIHPNDRDMVIDRYTRRLKGEAVPQIYDFRIVSKDGDIRWSELNAVPILWEDRPAVLCFMSNITERKRAEEALRESEERYRALFDRSLDCVFVHSFEGNFLDANEAALKLLGYEREDIPHLNFASLLSPDQLPKALANLQEIKETGAQKQVNEYRLRCKDGSFVDMEVIGAIIYHEGKPYAVQGVGRNITERKQAEEMLRQSEERYRTMLEEMEEGYYEVDIAGNFTFVNGAQCRILGYSRDELIGMNYKIYTPKEDVKAIFEAYNRVYQTGEPLKWFPMVNVRKDGTRLFVEDSVLPVRNDKGEVIGFRGVSRDVTERKKAEEALRQSEEKYRTILEEMGDGYFETDLAGNLTFVNDAMIRILGYSKEEMIGMNFRALRPEEEAKAVFKAYNRMYRTGEPLRNLFTEIICKDGRHIFAETSAFPIRNDKGEIIGFRGIRRDITEHKQAEDRLKESEQKYRLLFETSPDCIVQMDREGRYLAANPATAKSLGVPLEELVGKTIFEVQPQEVAQYRLGMVRKALDEWQPQIFEDERAGRYFNHIYIPTKISEQKEAVQMIARDITERRKMEEALRQSEENYKTLFNSSVIGMYVMDVETMKVVIGNRAAAEMAGFSSVGEGIGINPLDFVIPEDREQVLEIAGKEFEQDLRRTHEVRVRAKDGGIGWISITSAKIMHEGRLAALVSFIDISERKRAEEALRQSEERYRAILEKMEDSYFEVDLAGNLTFVNSAACRHLGYSREELLGMSYKGFTDEDYIESIFRVYNEVYRTATPNKGFPWKIIRKDGSPGFIDASVTPLRNDKGEIIGFSGVGRDVTERRKIEEQFILTDRLASIGQLAAGIAHELNNPLTSVIGFSDLLLERDLSADVKTDLVTVNQEARRAINIVKGLLAFAREQRVEKAPVDINSIIQGILQLRSYEQRVSNIEVDARFASALPPIMGNGAQLQQVFINIIINAEQAILEAHARGKLTIATERVGDIVRASITDDGPGISPDNMKKLFVPFFTTREVGKGTGLGLSICHGIVTEHGGKIYAESKLGKGATFVVELPISK
jgi:PAS domain S-box-containing protein